MKIKNEKLKMKNYGEPVWKPFARNRGELSIPNSQFPNSKSRTESGFSLIEVMVATLILLILVLMTGAVFRAGASAWDTGYAKAEGGTIVRAIVGTIQRELSKAVDGRYFGNKEQQNPDGTTDFIPYGSAWGFNTPVHVSSSGSELHFIYYRDNLSKASDAMRPDPVYVKYWVVPHELRRQEEVLRKNSDGKWLAPEWKSDPTTVINFAQELNANTAKMTVVKFVANTSNNTRKEYERPSEPWRITSIAARVEIYRSMKMSTLTVRSFGPDGQSGDLQSEKDDIVMAW